MTGNPRPQGDGSVFSTFATRDHNANGPKDGPVPGRRARAFRPSALRGGFTLVELAVVLAVIVAMVALAWPALRIPLAKSRLKEASKQVGAALGRARLMAIQSGTIQQFQFQPGGQQFQVVPYQDPQADPTAAALAADPTASQPPAGIGSTENGDLPAAGQTTCFALADGLSFFTPDPGEQDPSAANSTDAGATALNASAVADDQGWAPPIYFFPSGRSSNVHLRILGEFNYYADLNLRGLTGSVTIGRVHQLEASP
jgi:prepilin-type N-terminal cleavage/methylation domain-containing protein